MKDKDLLVQICRDGEWINAGFGFKTKKTRRTQYKLVFNETPQSGDHIYIEDFVHSPSIKD